MSNFGEDLRKERMSRGIALEHISAVTKISQRHLVALEQERFRLLPGGILSKGIVRGYVSALGLDPGDWTDRFMQACSATGQSIDDESGWTAFASNVGKARIQRHNEQEIRMRWIGAIVLAVAACIGGFFTVRYYGVRAGWWSSLLPVGGAAVHSAVTTAHSAVARILTWVGY
jgi:cytoskeleton protein RodZ